VTTNTQHASAVLARDIAPGRDANDFAPVCFSRATAAISVCARRGADPATLAHALAAYWLDLSSSTLADRRNALRAVRQRVRHAELTSRAFVVWALGEPDGELVREAVLDYIGAVPVSIERRESLVGDALDWIRRGLALNREAVFAALLSLDDPAVLERLAPLRLRFTAAERAAVVRQSGSLPAIGPAHEFLIEWRELLDA
jgi:hypothetical protein